MAQDPGGSNNIPSADVHGEDPDRRVAAVTIKIPPMFKNASAWFLTIEAQFRNANITRSQTRYDYVLAALTPDQAESVMDVITSEHADPYIALKAALTERTSESDRVKFERLLSGLSLGDRKPTQLLREIKQLSGQAVGGVDEKFVRQFFVSRLPREVQTILASTTEHEADKLARIADSILEVNPGLASINAVAAATIPQDDLRDKVDELTRQIIALTAIVRPGGAHGSRSRSRSRPRYHPRKSSRDSGNQQVCWYHDRFGSKANKCVSPCGRSASFAAASNPKANAGR